ncbi:MAG TPA: caspase family protein [Thermoanaerobaculia bacterium]|nr:caspase family protein [Thermoanaerobaculia bacterium]
MLVSASLFAQSASCNRARAIVEEVKQLYAAGNPDHVAILGKLRTAEQLCPTLGEAWKYSYCSATAKGDEASARMYRDRAMFNGITALDCPGSASGARAVEKTPLPGYVRQKYALVVGVGTFRDPSIPHLQYAAKDAKDFAAALIDSKHGNFAPENVTVLTDQSATRAAILNAMQQLFLQAQEDDLVVLYVSSHGSPGKKEMGLAGVGYIVTYDATIKNIWVDGIDYQDFAGKAALIRARRKVAFLDTCFSGQAGAGEKALSLDTASVDEKTAQMFLSGEGSYIITSSRGSERSWESDRIQNSYFTHFIIEALKRDEQPVTVKQLFDYVASKVADVVAREKQAPQHPLMIPSTASADVRIGVLPRPVGN